MAISLVGMMAASTYGQAEKEEKDQRLKFAWQKGPVTGILGGQGQVKVPSGYVFLPQAETGKFLEALDNIPNGSEYGVLMPKDSDWFLVFEFDDIGYVKDDDKGKLDADAMLTQMKKNDKASNEDRRSRGMEELNTVGWEKKPAYNESTHNLEWAVRVKGKGPEFINHHVKILGRHGVMIVTWVGDKAEMSTAMPKVASLLAGFSYTSGNKYAEFRSGDKIAKYGLTALVTGGAAAVLLKTGLLQKLWKPIVLGVAAVGAAIKRLFNRKSNASG